MSGRRLVARTVPAALQSGPGASPRVLGGANVCASRVRSRQVWRTLHQNHNESASLTFLQYMAANGEKIQSRFSRKPLVRFSQNFTRTYLLTGLPNGITRDPPPELGVGLEGPKFGGDPQQSPTSGFPGSEFLLRLVVLDEAYKKWGLIIPGCRLEFCRQTRKLPKLCRPFRHFRSSYLDRSTNLHNSDIVSPPISFWEKSDQGVSKKWVFKNWGWGTMGGYPLWRPAPPI